MNAVRLNLLALVFGLSICTHALAELDTYCVEPGNSVGDCDAPDSQPAPLVVSSLDSHYSIKVVVPKSGNRDEVRYVLPIERLAEIRMKDGTQVFLLGRFRDPMKATRVAQQCLEHRGQMCAKFQPEVVEVAPGKVLESALSGSGRLNNIQRNFATASSSELVLPPAATDEAPEPQPPAKPLIPTVSSGVVSADAYPAAAIDRQPVGLLHLDKSVRHLFWVDLQKGDLHVFANQAGIPRLIETLSVSIGKAGYGKQVRGDKKTPVGVYRLLSYLSDQKLDDFYGVGAYTLNYPNAQDRLHKRTGSGIWLHGVPKGEVHRPLKDSDGCVVASNEMIDRLGGYIDLGGTPIVLDDNLTWAEDDDNHEAAESLKTTINNWLAAWSARDHDSYLSYYGHDFTDTKRDLKAWKQYKRRINSAKKFIRVRISDLTLLAYPGEPNTVLARFYQRYESSNFNAKGWKEQLWRKESSGEWKIVYEKG